jgi:hypothetical protein
MRGPRHVCTLDPDSSITSPASPSSDSTLRPTAETTAGPGREVPPGNRTRREPEKEQQVLGIAQHPAPWHQPRGEAIVEWDGSDNVAAHRNDATPNGRNQRTDVAVGGDHHVASVQRTLCRVQLEARWRLPEAVHRRMLRQARACSNGGRGESPYIPPGVQRRPAGIEQAPPSTGMNRSPVARRRGSGFRSHIHR